MISVLTVLVHTGSETFDTVQSETFSKLMKFNNLYVRQARGLRFLTASLMSSVRVANPHWL